MTEHPRDFGQPWIGYPSGAGTNVEVMVVPVISGDIAGVRRELAGRYAGNLCLVRSPGRPSLTDQAASLAKARPALARLMSQKSNGIYATGHPTDSSVELVMLTPALYQRFTEAGLDGLDLRPWLSPAR